ncbi:RHTO0S10e02432g1_1 [Rhodotorula toruloides]|uniref:RHTO0S10e02432g1_1 n=1 Tax=Rhodotorula toruloides TaxID=5286 RepID=A0A061B4X9_RHOTO|nr:RHTO0S10e02432g1_1 [Rhodotorula toruloides]
MIGALDETIAAFEQLQTSVRELRAELTDLRAEKERAKFVYAAKLCLKALILDLMLKYAEKSDPETASDLYDRLHVLCLTNWRGLHDKLLSSYNRRYLEGIVPPSFFDALQAAVRAFKNKTLDPARPLHCLAPHHNG